MGINHDKLVLDWTKKVSSLAGKTEKGTDSDGKHTSADRVEEKGEDSTSNSLVPRLSRGRRKRAWYTLFAHALNLPAFR